MNQDSTLTQPAPAVATTVVATARDPGAAHRCGNCEAVLTGPYCAQCGQHVHASARNLSAVLHGAWHDITHVDGRLWHTLWLLFTRPGRLTVDYFKEHRARYLPPVRLYLVLSILFFGLGFSSSDHSAAAGLAAQGLKPAAEATAEVSGALESTAAELGLQRRTSLDCQSLKFSGLPALERAARDACTRNSANGGREFLKTLGHNIPRMMFVFLPLVACVMTLLYWRPRRYYVEHLVFLLHNHSAMFLCFLLLSLGELLTRLWHPLAALAEVPTLLILIYVPWYPYAALRRYYAQGRKLTIAKYVLIGCAYSVSLLITLLGTALISVLQS